MKSDKIREIEERIEYNSLKDQIHNTLIFYKALKANPRSKWVRNLFYANWLVTNYFISRRVHARLFYKALKRDGKI